jgi:CIC family chloride channel protein
VTDTAVAQAMVPLPEAVSSDAPLSLAADRLARSAYGTLPVGDDRGYLGLITARAVAEAMAQCHGGSTTVGSLVQTPTPIPMTEHLDVAIRDLDASEAGALPVVDQRSAQIVGWFDYDAALTRLRTSRP